ncbi:MAG: cytochrome c class [Acidobacteriales bacterium]|nr:cytochrome c class [Terriglobales bacterium]
MKIHLILSTVLLLVLVACTRETRDFQQPAALSEPASGVHMSELHPGGAPVPKPITNPFESNAYGVSEGKRLYESYNCVGCHAHGGGGIGPPLIDLKWIYGAEPANVYATIVEGRPNGMPSFRGKIPENQVWEIVAYVRSLSGQLSKDVSGGREDHMYGKKAESSTPKENPKISRPLGNPVPEHKQ